MPGVLPVWIYFCGSTLRRVILRQNNKSFAVNQWIWRERIFHEIETSYAVGSCTRESHTTKQLYVLDCVRGYLTKFNKIKTSKKKYSHSNTFIIILKQYSIYRIGMQREMCEGTKMRGGMLFHQGRYDMLFWRELVELIGSDVMSSERSLCWDKWMHGLLVCELMIN